MAYFHCSELWDVWTNSLGRFGWREIFFIFTQWRSVVWTKCGKNKREAYRVKGECWLSFLCLLFSRTDSCRSCKTEFKFSSLGFEHSPACEKFKSDNFKNIKFLPILFHICYLLPKRSWWKRYQRNLFSDENWIWGSLFLGTVVLKLCINSFRKQRTSKSVNLKTVETVPIGKLLFNVLFT